MQRSLTGALCAVLAGILATDALATTVTGLSDEAMTAQADTIVVGRSIERQFRWVDRDLFTFVTVAVTETLKGTAAGTVTVALPGGIDARRKFPVAMTYPGAPSIAPDEEVVLFLLDGSDISDAYTVAGFSQGKYSVVEDTAGVKHVARDLSGVQIAEGSTVTRGTRTYRLLAELRDDILRYLSQGGGGR